MKDNPGADRGFDKPLRMLLAEGRIEPKGTSLVRIQRLNH